MKKNKPKPNFLIVGAAKSGTTSLYSYLKQHPQIFMPEFKEPQYLVRESVSGRLHKSISNSEEYFSLFETATEQCIGEASVLYLLFHQEAIINIKAELGEDVKIIIILREPVSRAMSAYEHILRNSTNEPPFEEAILNEKDRYKNNLTLTPMMLYKSMSLYCESVTAYLNAFKDVHIVIYDDFSENPERVVNDIFDFLCLSRYSNINYQVRLNADGRQWKNKQIKKLILNDYRLKKIIKAIIPKGIRAKTANIIREKSTSKTKTKINNEVRINLYEYFKEDINNLESLINRDLSDWKNVT